MKKLYELSIGSDFDSWVLDLDDFAVTIVRVLQECTKISNWHKNKCLVLFDGGITLIFISGIHGAGKTFFTEKVKERCEITTYTASKLIADFKKCVFDSNKRVDNIFDNQQILLAALKEMSTTDKEFLLDGHFCLLDINIIS